MENGLSKYWLRLHFNKQGSSYLRMMCIGLSENLKWANTIYMTLTTQSFKDLMILLNGYENLVLPGKGKHDLALLLVYGKNPWD
jgi:hypothetical protein